MNTKINFLLLLILLVILILFYYVDLESNIIILLAVTIVILMHNIIVKKDHFTTNDPNIDLNNLETQMDTLIAIAKALKTKTSIETTDSEAIEGIPFNFSCPFEPVDTTIDSEISVDQTFTPSAIKLPFGTTLNNLTPEQLRERLMQSATTSE